MTTSRGETKKTKELVFHCQLFCPACGSQHVDSQEWAYTPHHIHLCENCEFEWRVEPYCFGVEAGHKSIFERELRCIGCGASVYPELEGVDKVAGLNFLRYSFECAGCGRLIEYRIAVHK